MFDCRVCSNTPFAAFFGFGDGTAKKPKKKADSVDSFEPRSGIQLDVATQRWTEFTNPRIDTMWSDQEKQLEVFRAVLSAVNAEKDPVTGAETECIFWHGKYGETGYPVALIDVDGSSFEMAVLRILVFCFAEDDAFDLVKDHDQIDTICGNRRCVNLSHVALPSAAPTPSQAASKSSAVELDYEEEDG
ncbi:MAG: hypothetical protein KVP17_003694 [Porospora cf. gigantea B]|uniref:uncharacterized protein n=1 Tax=Porospora cf. gigantea B TaxID=2853592 RepID=UPI003571F7E7|nr:MAG: hypothetical protein KVP17_003694 [Porospora cf. gigantea B]